MCCVLCIWLPEAGGVHNVHLNEKCAKLNDNSDKFLKNLYVAER